MKRQVILLVMLKVLAGCQTAHDLSSRDDKTRTESLNPASAAAIAADLTTEVSPFLPPGSALAILPNDKDGFSLALQDQLTRAGFSVVSDGTPAEAPSKGAIPIRIWSVRSGGDFMVRLSTPSHRLSRIYRNREEGATREGETSAGLAYPAGPLVVETIDPGVHP